MKVLQLATPPAAAGEPVSPQRKRRGPWLLLLLVIAGGVAAWFAYTRRPDPLEGLTLVEVRRGDVEDTVTALGKIQPHDYVDVGAQVSGQLKLLAVKVGDLVERGQLLAEIDPQLQVAKLEMDRAQLSQLEAERDVQKLQGELAKLQYERQIRMKQEGATREDAYDRAYSELRVAAAKLVAIEAQIRQMRFTTKADEAQLGYTRIYAPMKGKIVSIDARLGQTLIASQAAPVLMRISDLTTMTVWSQVSEADITRLKPGMTLYFTTLGSEHKWPGSLREVLPAPPRPAATATPSVPGAHAIVLYTALFDVDNAQGALLPEMSAQVFFVVARAKDALIIPRLALRSESEDGSAGEVTVVTAGHAQQTRQVKLGVRNRFDVQVSEGLAEGEHVLKTAPVDEGPQP